MSLILDPVEVADAGRTELDLMSGSIRVKPEGIDWGDTALELQKGKTRYGESVLDWSMPNRIVRAPIILQTDAGGETLIEAIQSLQAKVARITTEGGTLKRVRDAEDLFADVVSASVVIPDTWTGQHSGFEHEGEIVLECLPDFYGEEILVPLNNGTEGYSETSIDEIKGNYPGRASIIVYSPSADAKAVGYAFQARYTGGGTGHALKIKGDSLTPLDQAAYSSGDSIEHPAPGKDWTSVASTDDPFPAVQRHVGTYRVYARYNAYGSSPDTKSLLTRFIWSQGDWTSWEENQPVRTPAVAPIPGGAPGFLLDLGVVRLTTNPISASGWRGILQAKDENGNGVGISLQYLMFVPADETRGVVTAEDVNPLDPSGFIVNDSFQQTSGNLAGKTANPSSAGQYSAFEAGGSDFSIDATNRVVARAATTTNGAVRVDALDTGQKDVEASIDLDYRGIAVSTLAHIPGTAGGLVVRGVDSSNYLRVFVDAFGVAHGLSASKLYVTKLTGGVATNLHVIPLHNSFYPLLVGDPGSSPTATVHRLRVRVVDGNYWVWIDDVLMAKGFDSALFAGAISTGTKVGILDRYTGTDYVVGQTVRRYDNFAVRRVLNAPAIYSGKGLRMQTDGCYRQNDTDGSLWGEVVPHGDLPRVPVSGKEGRSVKAQIFASSGDLKEVPDFGSISFSAALIYRPCWLSVPEA